jgi:ubiquinone/menaquinone biosynthesis C-methylase UbiE
VGLQKSQDYCNVDPIHGFRVLMNKSLDHPQLEETRAAFDSVAADYDGPRGNNDLIQDMRREMWEWLERIFPRGSRLIDLGCGTGLDAVHLASLGYQVAATDWSAQMVERTRERATSRSLSPRVEALHIGAQELEKLPGDGRFDGAYSNLGPLNCVPDLTAVSKQCARLIKPGGSLVFTVIGRICPWEIAHYLRLGRWARAKVRFARDVVPVGMNHHTIWTRYYFPKEFYSAFHQDFELTLTRGLCVFAPPPYLTGVRARFPRLHRLLWNIDRRVAGWPLIRAMGDHFLVVMRRR